MRWSVAGVDRSAHRVPGDGIWHFFEHRKLRKSGGENDPSNVTLTATRALGLELRLASFRRLHSDGEAGSARSMWLNKFIRPCSAKNRTPTGHWVGSKANNLGLREGFLKLRVLSAKRRHLHTPSTRVSGH